jgi:hypothetical protein
MSQNIITFLILNQNTEADKHNNKRYNTAVQNGGHKLPASAIRIAEELK